MDKSEEPSVDRVEKLSRECGICLDMQDVDEMKSLFSCEHMFCKPCFKKYFEVVLWERSIADWACPLCNKPDLTGDKAHAEEYLKTLGILLQPILDPPMYKLYLQKVVDWTLNKNPPFQWSSKEHGPGDRSLQGGSKQLATETLEHTKRRGFTISSGQDYEVALCCLFFLRALRLSSDFFLSSSNADAGRFDDVVLFYRPKGDQNLKYRAILLQAKHREKTTQRKLTASNPFSLKGYLASFKNMRNLWEQPVNVQSKSIQFQDISLVLYTNTGCVIGDTASDVTASPDVEHLRDILNTGGRLLRFSDAQRAGLPEEPETSDFMNHLVLCTEQTSIEKVDQLLEEEIGKLLRLTTLNNAKKLVLELKHVVRDWWRKEWQGCYLTAQSDEWKRVLQLQAVQLNKDTLTIQNDLKLDFTKAALEQFKSIIVHKQIWITVTDKYQGTSTRVRLLKALKSCLVLDTNFLQSQLGEVEALWGTAVCPTLALDMSAGSLEEHSELLQRLQMVLSSQADRKLIIIANASPAARGEWFVYQAEATWSLFDSATKTRFLSVQVELQGKVVALHDVLDLDSPSIMSDKVIHSLCSPAGGVMKLGVAPPPPQEYYVPRCMQRITSKRIDIDTLEDTNTFLFPKHLNHISFLTHNSEILYLNNLETINHIRGPVFIGEECSDTVIRRICCKFCARGISGDFGEEGMEREMTQFFPLTWMCDEKDVVLEGVPGVGKSFYVTEMCSRVKERFPDSWVLRVDMGKHMEFIKERDFKCHSNITAFLLKGLPEDLPCLEQELVEHSLHVTGNVFLFLDAFDEISPDFTVKCCDLLKGVATTVRYRQMVVTTRAVTLKDVEEALGTKAFNLPVFSEDEKRLFLKQFCKAKGKNVDEGEISSLGKSSGGALEIPLFCRIAAEALLHHDYIFLKHENPWKKVILFQFFVQQSINNCLEEKLGLEISIPGVRTMLDYIARKHMKNLQLLAVKKLMPVEELSTLRTSTKLPLLKLGLVVDSGESIEFEHKTFAEYFLGLWLAHHWQQCPPQLLRELLPCSGKEFVAATLSWSLFQGLELHEAVARGDEDEVRALLKKSEGTIDRDRGGRSPLHVAAITQGKHEVVELLLAAGEDPYKKDDILGSNAVIYAEMFRNWKFLEVMLEKEKPLEGLKFFTDQTVAKELLIDLVKQGLTNLILFILPLHQGISHQMFDDEGNTLLHLAAANNNKRIVKVLIDMGHDVNNKNNEGDTPLHGASMSGHLEVVILLLQNGSDPNITNKNGLSTLILAADGGHLEVVKLLIEKGADPNFKTENGLTALMMAAAQGHLEVVKLLIEMGVNLNLKTKNSESVLMRAAAQGHMEVVKLLIDKGAESNFKTGNGLTMLMIAAGQGHLEVVNLLIEKGVDPYLTDVDGETAMMRAADGGHLEVVKLLIERGADLNLKSTNGETVLMRASDQCHLEVVKLLIAKGAEPDFKTENGLTALMMAAAQGHVQVVKLLLEMGADPNLKTKNGVTALMKAAGQGHLEAVMLLIEKGADPNLRDVDDESAMMRAATQGHLEIVKLLLDMGADPNLKTKNGETMLLRAAGQGQLEVVKLLIEMGADVNLRDVNKETPMMRAVTHGHLEVVKLLIETGADPYLKTENGLSALMMAAAQGHLEIAKLLIEMGADTNNRNKNDETALMMAAAQGHLEVVKLLIEMGADPNLKINKDSTAMMVAGAQGNME